MKDKLGLIAATAALVVLLVLFWPIFVIAMVIDSCFCDDGDNYYHRL